MVGLLYVKTKKPQKAFLKAFSYLRDPLCWIFEWYSLVTQDTFKHEIKNKPNAFHYRHNYQEKCAPTLLQGVSLSFQNQHIHAVNLFLSVLVDILAVILNQKDLGFEDSSLPSKKMVIAALVVIAALYFNWHRYL